MTPGGGDRSWAEAAPKRAEGGALSPLTRDEAARSLRAAQRPALHRGTPPRATAGRSPHDAWTSGSPQHSTSFSQVKEGDTKPLTSDSQRKVHALVLRPGTRRQTRLVQDLEIAMHVQAAQYLRMSTDHQRYSLANQSEAISEFASQHGYDVVATYQDAGKSGLSAEREGLKALLADVIRGGQDFSCVLVFDVSRWGRFQDPDEAAHYEFICREAGVDVIYCAEMFGRDPNSSVLKQIKRVMAGEYSRELSEKTRRGRRRQAIRGFCLGGVAPFGFRRQIIGADGKPGRLLGDGERKFRPDQSVRYAWGPMQEIAIVRAIFRMYASDGLDGVAIAKRLNAEGKPWKEGKPWTTQRVRNVLACELAVGHQVFNKTKCILGRKSPPLPIAEHLRAEVCKPVISRRMFNAYQLRRRQLGGRRRKTDAEMLSDLQQLVRLHGRLSTKLIDDAPGVLRTAAYRERFGGLLAAYQAAGFEGYWPQTIRNQHPQKMDKPEIIAGLQRLSREQGYITGALIAADRRLPSLTYIQRRFGTLADALETAGLPAVRKGPHGRYQKGVPRAATLAQRQQAVGGRCGGPPPLEGVDRDA